MIRAYAGCFSGSIQCTDRPGSIAEHHVMIACFIVEHCVMICAYAPTQGSKTMFYCGASCNDLCLCR
jgi:hypothetical protein